MTKPTIVSRSVEFRTPWLSVISKTVEGLPGSEEPQTYYGIQPADYVTVLALDESGRIVVVRQYRPMVEDYTLELPGGHVEKGQTPEQAARQELLEETGYTAGRMELLGTLIPDVGRLANKQWCFLASDLAHGPDAAGGEEGIACSTLSLGELQEHIRAGAFNHALHLAVLAIAVSGGKLSPDG